MERRGSKRLVVWAAVAGACLWVGYLAAAPGSQGTKLRSEDSSDLSAEIAELRAHFDRALARQNLEIASLRNRELASAREAENQREGLEVGPLEDSESNPSQPMPPREERRRMAEERMTTYHAALAAQGRDPRWADRVESRIESMLADGQYPGMVVQMVDCRTSLCEVKAEHASRKDFGHWASTASMHVTDAPTTAAIIDATNDDQSVVSTTYFLKDGADFPMVPERTQTAASR